MSFYKNRKVGRPTDDEQMMIYAIEKIIDQKGIPMDEIPECQTLEDLIEVKTLLESYNPQDKKNSDRQVSEIEIQDKEDENQKENQEDDFKEESESVNNFNKQDQQQSTVNDWTDLAEEVQEIESQRQESTIKTDKVSFVAENYDPFSEPIIERSYTHGQTGQQTQEDPEDEDFLDLEDRNTKSPLEDLNPATKRKVAEQTANTLLKGYARLVPQPFKWMSKLPEDKIEKMSFNGELDLTIEVSDGMTFEDYMRQTNEQLDEIFEVQDETLEEIKEPLIEVLMEQQLELTATQRLTMAIISHLAQMFTVALKLRQQNNRILSYQKHLTYLSRVKSA